MNESVGGRSRKMTVQSVLIIEDSATIRRLLRISLESEFDVLVAENGVEGIEIAIAQKPDVILLDVRMPVMDGPATLRCLKQDSRTARIPVILTTAGIQASEIETYRELDVKGLIGKPFDPLVLAKQIHSVLDGPTGFSAESAGHSAV